MNKLNIMNDLAFIYQIYTYFIINTLYLYITLDYNKIYIIYIIYYSLC